MDRGRKLTGADVLRILQGMTPRELRLPVRIPSRDSDRDYSALEDVRIESVTDYPELRSQIISEEPDPDDEAEPRIYLAIVFEED